MIGQTILHYRILAELGRGGMGVVYKAEDTRLARVVALKFLPDHANTTEEERSRFLQEARAASSLNHPHVCTIHGIEEYNGREFIEMEFVDGVTLRERIAKAPFGFNDAIACAIQIGEALHEAHGKGIVHRDIKSENVMVTAKNQIKVMDFGLAKLKGSLKLTKASSTVGTLSYMAPEQIQGGNIDARSDIFSFGAVLFEMLTRELPFRGEHDAAVMYSILNEEPKSVLTIVPDADAEIDRIIRRALEKDPADRYQHVDDMVSELGRLRKQTGRVTRPPATQQPRETAVTGPRTGRRQALKWTGIAAGLAVIAVATWQFFPSQTASLDSIAVLPFANSTADPETEYLAEGITENIINSLSRVGGIRVVPRSMVSRYVGQDANPQKAGSELNVRAVLTGKVTQRGDGLVIQAELIDVDNISQLWGEQYIRKLDEIITVQQEIARAVAENLRGRVTGDERRQLAESQTRNPEAYQAYLKGRFFWNKRSVVGYKEALRYYEEAIRADSLFALAHVGVAEACFVGSELGLSWREAITRARTSLYTALKINPALAEAHSGMAIIAGYHDFDFKATDDAYRRSIELNPRYPTARHWYGEFLVYMGRFEEGLAEYRRAMDLDPASLPILSDYGIALYYARQYDRSIEQLRKTIEMDPGFVRTHFYIILPYLKKGMHDEAFEELILGMQADNVTPEELRELRDVYIRLGFNGVAQRFADKAMKTRPNVVTQDLARYHIFAGNTERALALLEEAYEIQHLLCVGIKVDPTWDDLRTEPRFTAVMEKMGFVNKAGDQLRGSGLVPE